MFDDVRDLYSAEIRTHGRSPIHAGRPVTFDASAKGDNPMCGDRVQVFVRHEAGRVASAAFEARGCEITIASADLMCEAVHDQSIDRIRSLAGQVADMARTGRCDVCDAALQRLHPLSAVHEYPSRIKCVTLPWNALLAALDGEKETTSE